jgi:hypothetical protein
VATPRLKNVVRKRNSIQCQYKGCEISITRDSHFEDWYIQVTHRDGCYIYDGWWKDSSHRTLDDAIKEAIDGSLLTKPKPEVLQPSQSTE